MRQRQLSIAKITRPRITGVYERKRLFKLLDQGRDKPVTWISGPAGSGKTTLVASYLDARKLPCLWYQVDEGDADIASFFYYLGLAAKKAAPRIKQPLPLLTPEYQFGIPTFTKRYFENLCNRLKPPYVIVFDNYQEVPDDSPFQEMIQNGLSEISHGMRVMIVSRSAPPAAFARMEANTMMGVIDWEKLCLTPEETSGMLKLRTGKPVSKESLQKLYEKTSGWAAGVVLMEVSQRRGGDEGGPEAMVPGRLSDYFAGEIFDKIDNEMREFLLKTAYLPRMTPSMAETITGNSRAGLILMDLHRRNSFTERSVERGFTYQYHALFREFLQKWAEHEYPEAVRAQLRLAAAKLLEEAGQIEDAAELYREEGIWAGLIQIILNHAQSLSAQGRHAVLEKWLVAVPAEIEEQIPWLSYWMGVCRLPFNPAEAQTYFEKAYAFFKEEQDPAGLFLSWSGVVESFLYDWNDLSALDRWISELDRNLVQFPAFSSINIEAQVALNFFAAVFLRQPWHPQLPLWEKRVETLMEMSSNSNFRLMSGHYLMLYNVLIGNIDRADWVFDVLRRSYESTSPAERIIVKMVQAYYFWAKGSGEESLKAVKSGLEAAGVSGVHIWSFTIASIGAYSSLASGDRAAAAHYLENMASFLDKRRAVDLAHYHYILGWQALRNGDARQAQEHAHVFLRPDSGGVLFFTGFHHIAMAMILFALGNSREAFVHLKQAKEIGKEAKSALIEFHALLVGADFELVRGKMREGHVLLRTALSLGRENQLFNFDWWLPEVMARLCTTALEQGVEIPYVQGLIRKHALYPETPPLHIENWPWPIRIHTLSRFGLLKDGKPVRFSGKVQKKPLEMLKAIIALGGREVQGEQIAAALWPDADGDAAYKAFGITLIRLRELLGVKDAVRLSEGNVTLDQRYFWIDTWAFEKMIESAQFPDRTFGTGSVRSEKSPKKKSAIGNRQSAMNLSLLEKALELYKGSFLGAESATWAISLRERLRDKFLWCISAAGMYWEERKEWDTAIGYYKKGLEADDLAEEFYRRIILCHQRLGRNAEALSAYNRCKKTLASYGIDLSSETKALLKKD